MRNRLLALAGFLLLTGLAFPAVAQETQPGAACTAGEVHHFLHAGGPENPGAGYLLVCDGSNWQRVMEWDTSTSDLGVKQAAPKAPLHVGGEAIVGNTGLACDEDRKGGLRWSDAESTIEMCDGTTWRKIAATAAAGDCTPDAFSFTDLANQPLNTLVVSDSVNITGIDPDCTVSVSGSGTPQVSVNGGAWVGATAIDPGDSLRARMITSGSTSTERIAAVTVGTVTDNWSVTTVAGATRIFSTPGNYAGGSLGGIGGAHTICQTEAGALGYGGIWRALLSNESIDARDLVTITYPVVRAAGGVTVDSLNLWDGNLQNSVETSGDYIWTGTLATGQKNTDDTCGNWRSNSATGNRGNSGRVDNDWTQDLNQSCSSFYEIYCVDQPATLGAILTVYPVAGAQMHVNGAGSPAYGAAVTFTVENVGDETSATISTSLSNTTNFEFTADNCGGNTLAQGATCTVDIRPKAALPGGEGALTGTFNVTANNNPGAPLSGWAGATEVFVTASAYRGDSIGGLPAADTLCQTEATNKGYSGAWKALMSDDTTDAKDRVTITYPVIRAVDGVVVDSVNLWDGSLENDMGAGVTVWTGTRTNGTKASNTCSGWSGGTSGEYGEANDASPDWMERGSSGCTGSRGFYCISQ